jgi:NtrC-family two-component system response regulator AlgB
MERVIELARQVAASDATILLRGESGTGKTVLARAIHAWSNRAGKAMGVVSCPSFSSELLESELFGHVRGAFTGAVRDNPGRIAACEGGTLFLDEIGDLPLSLQPKILRFVQEREYERVGDYTTRKADVRIIAATNIDLEKLIREGRFREDLFYRLNVIQIEIPPLRERTDDLLALAENLLRFYSRVNHRSILGFTNEASEALKRYTWPGNVRELSNVIERAAILCRADCVGLESLPPNLALGDSVTSIGDKVSLEKIEEQHIRRILASTKSLQEAAEVLGVDQATLWRRRKKYEI